MRCTLILVSTLLLQTAAAAAQTASPDSQMTQTMLAEIRQLRQDLQATAVTIGPFNFGCNRFLARLCLPASGASLVKTLRRAIHQRGLGLQTIKSSAEMSAGDERQCQVEQIDAENQFRVEQAKMAELQDQLDELDQALAGHGRK